MMDNFIVSLFITILLGGDVGLSTTSCVCSAVHNAYLTITTLVLRVSLSVRVQTIISFIVYQYEFEFSEHFYFLLTYVADTGLLSGNSNEL